MKKIFLFSFIKDISTKNNISKKEKFLIVFYPYKNINKHPNDIYNQLRNYFQFNILPDKIIVLCSSFNQKDITELFQSGTEIYNYIPLFSLDEDYENISINSLQQDGAFKKVIGFSLSEDFLTEVINRGLVKIFNKKGGLIVSQSVHHFVFPSGKHSDRFLRPGNVLLNGIHICFMAFALYRHLNGKKYTSIYCDTSSINSLAFVYINLIKEFDDSFNQSVQVESFGSYEGFESAKFSAPKDSLFIISASTSGSIIERLIRDKKQVIQLENICILYGLDVEASFSQRMICNLSRNEKSNPEGLLPFESYNVNKGNKCKFCEDNSKPVAVVGDVFLLEKPNVSGKLLTIYDNPPYLKNFFPYFKKNAEKESIIKSFYKENSVDEKKYEIYFDVNLILKEWENRNNEHPFEPIFQKIEKYVLQNIPATTKYIIVLPDKSSSLLAEIILEVLKEHNVTLNDDCILTLKEIDKIDSDKKGAIVIVSSAITTGRNLLFVSRALRKYENNYQRLYFTFINRASNKKHAEFIESNLSLGEFGKGTHRMVAIENIFCADEAYETPWHIEKEFLKSLEEYCETNGISSETIKYCSNRIEVLNNSGKTNGLVNNLFFPSLKGVQLKINKGFAFAPTGLNFIKDSTQADIFFIVSTILNDCRNNAKLDQSEYVRNLLEPGNFIRFNDGIIQAAILRAAKYDELRFDISSEMSLQIQSILEDMINHMEDEHAEGLIEFIYAIAIKKIRLKKDALTSIVSLIEAKLRHDSILNGMINYTKHNFGIAFPAEQPLK